MMGFDSWLAERFILTNEGRSSWERGIREFDCPFCGDREHKFWFSLRTQWGGCLHKSKCGWKGDVIKFVMAVERCSFREAVQVARADGGSPWVPRRRREPAQDAEAECQLPPATYPVPAQAIPGHLVGAQARAYLRGRGVTDEEIARYGLGYCATGRYGGRVILPVHEAGALVFFVARLFQGRGKPYRYPTTEEAGGRGPSDVLAGLDEVRGCPRVRVVEGYFDRLAERRRGEAAVAMLGLGLSQVQVAKLALAGCQEAVVECDGDAPLREIEKVARRVEGVMRVSVARPRRDPDEERESPRGVRWGIAARVRAALGGKG